VTQEEDWRVVMADIYDQREYDAPVDISNEHEKRAQAQELAEEAQFFDYEDRGLCPVCSIEQGKDVPIPKGNLCVECGGFTTETVDHVIGLQEWHKKLAKVYRGMLTKCEISNKICHPTETAATAHAEQLAQRRGYRASVYFHKACNSFHVGECRNNFKRKL
jgi:hypothetical protein